MQAIEATVLSNMEVTKCPVGSYVAGMFNMHTTLKQDEKVVLTFLEIRGIN